MITACQDSSTWSMAIPQRRGTGAATLTMVMVLFFVMAMVTAYTSRSMLYEQRMSINNFRAAASIGAAEAGIDWAIAMLNGARVDSNCQAPVTPTANDIDFRTRYLTLLDNGSYTSVINTAPGADGFFYPTCVMTSAGWSCKCPSTAAPSDALVYPNRSAPIFNTRVSQKQPGAVIIETRGSHESSLVESFQTYGNYMRLGVTAGLVRALPVPPLAALTAGNTIAMSGSNLLAVSNTDPQTGVTLHAGSGVTATNQHLIGPAGSVENTSMPTDAVLLSYTSQPAPPEATFKPTGLASWQLFLTLFGMDAATFSRQPGAVFVNCGGGCNSASIETLIANNPSRVIWIDGDINLNAAVTLGSAAQPLMMVASGDITLSAAVQINGFIYGRDIAWQSAGPVVRGAVVAARDFIGNGDVAIAYDAAMMKRISVGHGSFVRLPGSWTIQTVQ
jgi:hypothetical protein